MEARFLNCVRRAYLDVADLVHGEQEQEKTDGGELDGGCSRLHLLDDAQAVGDGRVDCDAHGDAVHRP